MGSIAEQCTADERESMFVPGTSMFKLMFTICPASGVRLENLGARQKLGEFLHETCSLTLGISWAFRSF